MNALSALEEISIDSSKVLPRESQNYEKTINKFLLRPSKYQGIEVTLTMKVLSEIKGSTLKDELVKTLGLELGDTLSVDVNILKNDRTLLSDRKIAIYADKDNADWLENVSLGNVIRAKVKTAFCSIKELSNWDEGRTLTNNTYLGLVILKGLEIFPAHKA